MTTRIRWSKGLIQNMLLAYTARLGRMPSANELRANNDNALACAIPRWGGYREWASQLGVSLKGTETHWALSVEDMAQTVLENAGFSVVRQTTKAPFDLLVNGHRVDVKAAHPSIYGIKDGYIGWIFRTAKPIPTCDFYLCFCFDGDEDLVKTYVIPSLDAQITTITITTHGRFEQYRDRIDLLR